MADRKRIIELSKLSKAELARIHAANGGLMGADTYRTWTKAELLEAVIEDEEARGA